MKYSWDLKAETETQLCKGSSKIFSKLWECESSHGKCLLDIVFHVKLQFHCFIINSNIGIPSIIRFLLDESIFSLDILYIQTICAYTHTHMPSNFRWRNIFTENKLRKKQMYITKKFGQRIIRNKEIYYPKKISTKKI